MNTDQSAAAQPIIIRRKKVYKADGHHGGAWKVAYADFVTAMMAFFLLMWLLNATTEEQRKGLADYFNPTVPMRRFRRFERLVGVHRRHTCKSRHRCIP
jgi:chemotaxis protein MotB